MKKLTAVIVDDEALARENLRMLLDEYCPEIEVLGDAGSVDAAASMITALKPEVVFLDIRMPSGTEGFELLESMPEKNFQVIFVTAFKDYAIRAFNANAIHYILKPVDIDELKNAVAKLVKSKELFIHDPESYGAYQNSLEHLTRLIRQNLPIQRITINHAKGFKMVDIDQITRLEASGNCTRIFFEQETEYLDTRTLKVYEDLLDPMAFCRIHKSHIINIRYLQEYLSEGNIAVMKDGSRLQVSRNRLPAFLNLARSYSGNA